MKMLILSFLFLFSLIAIAQKSNHQFTGKYRDPFGNKIQINADSTFNYTWHFDLLSSWTNGTWRIKNDTLYLKAVLVYDTLRYKNGNNKIVDSLVLSETDQPKLTTVSPSMTFLLGRQNSERSPDKLFYKDEKLYKIDSTGRLVKRKVSFWGKEKFNPWYVKEPEK